VQIHNWNWNYNKKKVNEMGVMMMEMQGLMTMIAWPPTIRVVEKMMPYASSPSRSLPEVRFVRLLVALNVESQIHLRVVKVFDESESVPHGACWR
jgi:hypothetical protein